MKAVGKPDELKNVASLNDFQLCTMEIIDAFLEKQNSLIYPPLKIQPYFHTDRKAYETSSRRAFAWPVFIEKSGESFMLHLCEEKLNSLPFPVLQGWLIHHAALCIPKMQPAFFTCNYLKNIFPLMPVSGLATNHILQVITHLERALQQYMVVESLIGLGYGISQCHYYFHKVRVVPEDFESYNLLIPHKWSRSLFICRILEDYMGIVVLARQNVHLSTELESFWSDGHPYLLPSDLDLIHSICHIPALWNRSQYCDKVVEMFKLVRDTLLQPEPGETEGRSVTIH
jgi:hypothetical protein